MQRFPLSAMLLTWPVAAALMAIAGCGGNKDDVPVDNKANVDKPGPDKPKPPATAKTELVSTGWGTLSGKVTFDGDPPPRKEINIDKNPERCACKEAKDRGDTEEQKWKVGPDKGVANVVVWVRAPKGTYFKIPEDQADRKDVVTLDQPYCAFEPHVLVLYPSYYDGATKKQKKTGQGFEVANSATIAHNTNYNCPTNPMLISGRNLLLPPKEGDNAHKTPIQVKACNDSESGGEQELTFVCDVHRWMNGFARVFDHPFVGVTKGDNKEDMKDAGAYEIKQVPAGVELEVVYWHESMPQPKVLKKIKLEDGKTEPGDFKIK